MPLKESLRYAIALILDTNFDRRFAEGVDRLAGYVRRRAADGAPRVTRDIRETWVAFARAPVPGGCDEIAVALLRDVRSRCAERGLAIDALTPAALDAIEELWS